MCVRLRVFIGCLFLWGLTLVYGGLSAVEKGMHDLLALERPLAALRLQPAGEGAVQITFAGQTWTVSPRHWIERVRELWRRTQKADQTALAEPLNRLPTFNLQLLRDSFFGRRNFAVIFKKIRCG